MQQNINQFEFIIKKNPKDTYLHDWYKWNCLANISGILLTTGKAFNKQFFKRKPHTILQDLCCLTETILLLDSEPGQAQNVHSSMRGLSSSILSK